MKVSTILKQQNNTPADDKIEKKKKTSNFTCKMNDLLVNDVRNSKRMKNFSYYCTNLANNKCQKQTKIKRQA